jgi:hypothetical protein
MLNNVNSLNYISKYSQLFSLANCPLQKHTELHFFALDCGDINSQFAKINGVGNPKNLPQEVGGGG